MSKNAKSPTKQITQTKLAVGERVRVNGIRLFISSIRQGMDGKHATGIETRRGRKRFWFIEYG